MEGRGGDLFYSTAVKKKLAHDPTAAGQSRLEQRSEWFARARRKGRVAEEGGRTGPRKTSNPLRRVQVKKRRILMFESRGEEPRRKPPFVAGNLLLRKGEINAYTSSISPKLRKRRDASDELVKEGRGSGAKRTVEEKTKAKTAWDGGIELADKIRESRYD